MDITSFAQGEHDRLKPRTLSDISITSNTSGKAQSHPSFEAYNHVRDKRVKLMCSYGGKILPRPSDRKLRYVGGETRMVSVPRHIRFEALLQKMTEIYGPDLTVKYQLPDEDLDALVSVLSDEDLENMMDECDRLDALEGASRLRVFVFSSKDTITLDLNDIVDPEVSELRYVDAVNAVQVDASLKKNDDFGFVAPSQNIDGHPEYGWNTPQMHEKVSAAHPENFKPSANMLAYNVAKSNNGSDAVSPPPAEPVRQHTAAPLEFVSIRGADRTSYYGAGVGGDEFRDLESGGSASSSASSQHDLYNRYSSHQWAPRAQRQPPRESLPYGSQLQDLTPCEDPEDQLKKTEQPHIKDVRNKKGGRDSGVSATGINVLPPERLPDAFNQFNNIESAEVAKKLGTNLHGTPLSPGAMLQKQLQADLDSTKLTGAECLQPILNGDVTQPTHEQQQMGMPPFPSYDVIQPLNEQQQMGRPPFPLYDCATAPTQDMTLDVDHLLPDFLHTQLFQPGEIHHPTEGASNLALFNDSARSVIPTRQIEEAGKSEPFLQEAKLNESTMDLSVGFSQKDYAGTMYNEDGRERDDGSMFASQAFPQEPYNVVFQSCSSEIPLSSMDEADEFLLSPMRTFTEQRSVRDYHDRLSSQAPWLSPDSISFSLSSQGNSSMLDSQSLQSKLEDTLGNRVTQPMGTPRTQNYEGVQGTLPLLSRLYSPHRPLFGEPVQQDSKVVNTSLSEADSLEELSEQGRISKVLPLPQLTECVVAENPIRSNRVSSLGSLGEPNDEHDATEEKLSYATVGLSELSSDGNQGFVPLKEPVLQQESTAYSCAIGRETEVDTKETGDEQLPTSFPVAPSMLETWSTTIQSQLESQSAVMENESVEVKSRATMEKDMTIEEPKSEIDETDTFQTAAADKSMSPAAAAEVEAIARGLQIIRHCDLEELRELGSGTFGTVYHGKWRGTDVAIKRIKSSCFTGRSSERERLIADFWREACILGQLHHPNVVAFYGVVPDGPGVTLATVTEFMVNGSLKQALQKKDRPLDHRKRLLIAMDAAFGMEYLHQKNVVHFDLKCENLLVNLRDLQRPICKVGDLGLSKVKQQTMVSGGVRGTLPWMAPELLNGSSSLVSEKVDVFSFGIVLWELLTGEEPYATMHYGAIIGGIVSNTLRPPVPRWCNSAWKSLMETCWSADPGERPTFSEIARSLRTMEAAFSARAQAQAQAQAQAPAPAPVMG
eukprot:c24360_g2_i1 orf=300-3977(+)